MSMYIDKGAVISACGKYRYRLWREWRGTHDPKNWRWMGAKDGAGAEIGWPRACVFIMLNPSTADGNEDDPTIRRCVAFAKAWKFERLEVVNLFAYRATNPAELLALGHKDDPVGHENQHHVEVVTGADCGLIVCAWGSHGAHLDQDETMLGWFYRPAYALGFTGHGRPRHPLYLPRDTKLVPMLSRAEALRSLAGAAA